MGEDPVAKGGVRELSHHRNLDDRHDLAPGHSENRGAENPAGALLDERFHEPSGLVALERPGDARHRKLRHAEPKTSLSSFSLAQANPPELGVDENAVGHEAVSGAAVSALDEVSLDDSIVVVRDVGESRAAVHVPERVDAGDVRLEALVHSNEPPLVDGHPGRLEAEAVRVGKASDGYQHLGSPDRPASLGRLHRENAPRTAARRAHPRRREQKLEAILAENFLDLGGDVLVLPREEMRSRGEPR